MPKTIATIYPHAIHFPAFQSGDSSVFKQIFQHYYRSLRQYAWQMVKCDAVAEDIVVDAFVKLYQRRTYMESFAHLHNFLYTCARNACIDHYHYLQRERRRLGAWPDEPLFIDPTNDPDSLHDQALQLVYTQSTKLPPVCRRVFQLFFLDNKTTPEIAQALGIRPQTVLNQKTRAIRLLRERLVKIEYERKQIQ